MPVMLFKALIRGGAAHDLFAAPVQVKAHVRDGHLIGPYVAIRKKAGHVEARQSPLMLLPPSPMRPTIIVRHDVVPAHPAPAISQAEAIWRQGVMDDSPGSPPAPTRNFGWDASSAKSSMVGDVKVEEDPEAQRLRLHFPGKPSADIIAKLKQHGFRWAPSERAWQRQLTSSARYAAAYVLKQAA